MARNSSPIAQYAVLGVLGLLAWNWASEQPAGSSARKTIDQLRGAIKPGLSHAAAAGPAAAPAAAAPDSSGSPPSSGGPQTEPLLGSGFQATTLVDFGHQAIVYDASAGVLRQDPALGGTNIYGPGDSFFDQNGAVWTWTGRQGLLQGADGSVADIESFFA